VRATIFDEWRATDIILIRCDLLADDIDRVWPVVTAVGVGLVQEYLSETVLARLLSHLIQNSATYSL